MSFSTYDNTIICISAPNGTVGLADHPGANNVLFQLTDDAPCSLVRFSSGDDVLATAQRLASLEDLIIRHLTVFARSPVSQSDRDACRRMYGVHVITDWSEFCSLWPGSAMPPMWFCLFMSEYVRLVNADPDATDIVLGNETLSILIQCQ